VHKTGAALRPRRTPDTRGLTDSCPGGGETCGRHIRIEGRTRRDRPWLEVLALDPRDLDLVRAKTIGRCGQRQQGVTGK
jgi:hypothetical protein